MFSVFNIIVLSDRQAVSFHMFWQFYSLHSSCQKGPPGSATQYDSVRNKVKKMMNLWFITSIGRKVRSQRVTAFAIFILVEGFSLQVCILVSNMVLPRYPCREGLLSKMVCILLSNMVFPKSPCRFASCCRTWFASKRFQSGLASCRLQNTRCIFLSFGLTIEHHIVIVHCTNVH